MKSKVENGTDPIVEYFRKGSAASHLSPDDFRADYFTSARHLHLSGVAAALSESSYALLEHAAKVMKAEGKTLSFDPNLRPVLWKSEAEMVEKLNRLAFRLTGFCQLKEGVILTGQQTPEGSPISISRAASRRWSLKPAATALGSRAPAANRERLMPLKSKTSSIPSAPATALPSG